jgi:anti-anti-sigma factor
MEIARDGSTIILLGDVDVRTTSCVRDAVYDALNDHEVVVVDLTGVTSADLTALRLIAVATRRAAQQGRHLSLRGAQPCVRRMLHLTHLAQWVDLESVATARR